jgi:type I pantothenate kinase
VIAELVQRLCSLRPRQSPYLIGITGAVSVGKTTLARSLADSLSIALDTPRVETVSSDGFLWPNSVLEARGLLSKKGFPESYDMDLMRRTLGAVRGGSAHFPVHSHVTYDIDPALSRFIERPDVLILEGLSLAPMRQAHADGAAALDHLIYVDADEALIENWYVERFLGFWEQAEHDPTSFYVRFRHLDLEGAAQMAHLVWTQINLPNLQTHIRPARSQADTVLTKGQGHKLINMSG